MFSYSAFHAPFRQHSQTTQFSTQANRSLSATSSHYTVITMSQSRIPQPSQGSSRSYTPNIPPPNRASASTTSFHGPPVTRVGRVVFYNPNQGGRPMITVMEMDGQGEFPGHGRTMDLVDDSTRNGGTPWRIFTSTITITFVPTGPYSYGIDWSRLDY